MNTICKQNLPAQIRGIYCGIFISLFASCINNPPVNSVNTSFRKIDSVKSLITNGDLILRNGTDEVSMATRKFNRRDTTYSHCGIIQIENDTAFVYHALGGRYNPSQKLIRQVIDSFCNPKENDGFAVYRYDFSDTQRFTLARIVRNYHHQQLPFDMFFNYETSDKMYCSEFVFKSINQASENYLLQFHPLTQPMYITIDDLYTNPGSRLIKKVTF